jgi:glycosyltransferase involved in cell wall biosynthesis
MAVFLPLSSVVKVSIVTPSYNQAPFLAETIESVLAQDYPDLQYVVVDDGSTDGSLEIARRYESQLHALVVQENAGQVAAINNGFRHTDGELMAFVNSDDTLLPGAISEMVTAFEEDPALVMVYGDSLYTDEHSNETGYLTSRVWDPVHMIRSCENHVVQPSSMWTRRAWELAGPFDERAYYFFDFEFYLRLSVLGPVRRVAKPWSTYREHDTSKSASGGRGKPADYVRFADDFLPSDRLPEAYRPYVREGRSSAYIRGGNDFYGPPLEVARARRLIWRGLAMYPRNASPLTVSLAVKSLLPRPAVRALRARRAARRG